MNDIDRVTICIKDDGRFNVKFNMPEIEDALEREDFLRHIGGIIAKMFSMSILPGVAKSFASTDEDGKFLANFITVLLELKKIANLGKEKAGSPVVRPTEVFKRD